MRLFLPRFEDGKLVKLRMWKDKPITKVVEVTYIDHYEYEGPVEGKRPKYNIETAVGYLLEEDEDSILIGNKIPWDRRVNCKVMRIYKTDILEINVLVEFPTLSDYF